MTAGTRPGDLLIANDAVTTVRPGRKRRMTTLEIVLLVWAIGQFTGVWQVLLSLLGYWLFGWR